MQILSQPSNSHTSTSKLPNKSLIIFELGHSGHYAAYIQHLVKYWCDHKLDGKLNFVICPTFVNKYPEIIKLAENCQNNSLKFIPINQEEEDKLIPRKSSAYRLLRSIQEWQLVVKYANKLKATHCLLLFFDPFQTVITLRLKLPCAFSGIYFRPSFHYPNLNNNYIPSFKERLQYWREKFILPKVARHPQLQNIFCLDQFAITSISKISRTNKAVYLPDPVKIDDSLLPQQIDNFKEKLGIASNRKVFLLFGTLYDSRKGLKQVLEAVTALPLSLCQQITLLLAGQIEGTNDLSLQKQIEEISSSLPVQIIIQDKYIPEKEVSLYFQASDVILAPYQRHVGMSGIIVQAAAYQKPVLSSNYGLMGKIVNEWQLGLTIDSTIPAEIAEGLKRFILESPDKLVDLKKMQAFALQNQADKFAECIFKGILS
jgi:glycosyltransferase involved in cell wall biosynthesis